MSLVFVSHASADAAVAERVCQELEQAGLRGWIAQRDVPAGSSYPSAILRAIRTCAAGVLVLSEVSNSSPHVIREVERIADRKIPLLVVRVDPVTLNDDLEYFVSLNQWLDADRDSLDDALRRLVDRVREVTAPTDAAPSAPPPATLPPALGTRDVQEALGFSELADRQRQLLAQFGKVVLDVVCGSARPWEPRSRRALLAQLHEDAPAMFAGVTYRQFSSLLDDARTNGCLPGLSESPEGVFVIEENIAVKLERNKAAKLSLARWAADRVTSGQFIGLDGGSTTLPIASRLAEHIEDGLLTDLSVLTNSLAIAQVFSALMAAQGWTDEGCPVRVHLAGGLLRANTHATAWEPSLEGSGASTPLGIERLDLCFLGANGFTRDAALTMGADDELHFKRSVMTMSEDPYFVADSSKCGVTLPVEIASWTDDRFTLVTNELEDAEELDELVLTNRIIEVP